MKTIYKTLLPALFLIVGALFLQSCEDDVDPRENARLFMPDSFIVKARYNGLTASWRRSPGVHHYEVDLALNAEFDPIERTNLVHPDSLTTKFANLEERTQYYLRLRAVSDKAELNSKYVYTQGKTDLMYSIFAEPTYQELGYTYVTLRWTAEMAGDEEGVMVPVDADELVLTSSGAEDRSVEITPEILAAGSLKVEGLSEGVSYRATMKKDGGPISYIAFKMPSVPENGILVDKDDDLKGTIENAPDGAVILLTGGQKYDCSAQEIELTKAVTITGAPGAPSPVLYLKQFVMGGNTQGTYNMDHITISHLEISGVTLNGETEDPSVKPAGQAVFFFPILDTKVIYNITIGKLTMDDCVLRNYAASVIQQPRFEPNAACSIHIGEISVNDALVYDMRSDNGAVQSFIHLSSSGNGRNNIYCGKYSIKNSTFHHLYTGLIEHRLGKDEGAIVPEVEIANCTFDQFAVPYKHEFVPEGTSSRNFLNFQKFNAKVSISNCIFGQMKVDDKLLLKKKAFDGATGVFLNTYRVTDTNGYFTDFTGASNIGHKAEEVFPGRDESDYTIAPGMGLAGVGDPRWEK